MEFTFTGDVTQQTTLRSFLYTTSKKRLYRNRPMPDYAVIRMHPGEMNIGFIGIRRKWGQAQLNEYLVSFFV
jgi:hypothetical protein